MNIQNRKNSSRYIYPLSPACKMCARGSKMVLLITGLCPSNCFYCPLSKEKLNTDRIFADEWELEDEEDTQKILKEGNFIDAEGAGITGGDPLIVWRRTKQYIELLKNYYGSKFHIHLYTSGVKNYEYIDELSSAGLDEIRFHPNPVYWNKMEKSNVKKSIKKAMKNSLDVAIEIPVIPNMKNEIIELIKWSEKNSLNWVNLNELEFSETNADALISKNYNVKNDISSAVKGSEKTAYEILDFFSRKESNIGIHYCSSSFKDGVQLRNRIKRRAKNIAKNFETVTEDGTILKGIIEPKAGINLKKIANNIIHTYNITENNIFIDEDKNRLELSINLVRKLAEKKNFTNIMDYYIIEEYPTADSLEVERIPLN